jgi:hypothetical protein
MANNGNVDLGDLSGQETPFLLEGSLEPALPLPLFAVDASGTIGARLDGYPSGLTLPSFGLANAGMADGMQLPAFGAAGTMEAGSTIAGRLAMPAFGLSGSLEPPLALPFPQVAGTMSAGARIAAQLLQLPVPQVSATAGANAASQLEPFALAAAGLAGTVASANVSLLSFRTGASALQDTTADGQITLGLLQVNAWGGADALIEGNVTLDRFALAATAGTGQTATALLTLPLFEVGADSHDEAIGNATIVLPAFQMGGAGAFTLTLTRPHTVAVVLNTRLKGVVRYDGVAANSFAQFAGMQLAATGDGIVALMGDTDLGAPIAASIVSGTSDLSVPQRKRIEAGYVGYRSQGEMEMTLITDEHHEYTYRLVPRQIPDAIHSTRVKFGRGVDGNYWAWKLANVNGGRFDLASMQLNVNPLARSV